MSELRDEKRIDELKTRLKVIERKLRINQAMKRSDRRRLNRESLKIGRELGRLKGQLERPEKKPVRITSETHPELLEVEVLQKYRMVHFSGSESQVEAHYDLVKAHQSKFDILSMHERVKSGGSYGRTAFGKTTSGKVSPFGNKCTITFGSDEGLAKYLEFCGWQLLPDKFACNPPGLDH